MAAIIRDNIDKPIGKFVGEMVQQYHELLNPNEPIGDILTHTVVTGAWRVAILVKQKTSKNPAVNPLKKSRTLFKDTPTTDQDKDRAKKRSIDNDFISDHRAIGPHQVKSREPQITFNTAPFEDLNNAKRNFHNNKGTNQIIIYNTLESPYQRLVLQNRPHSLDFKGETSWAVIHSMGRNTQMYHYTGSEDIIQFNISWYVDDPNNREEVLTKCRLLEAWSKSNGYVSAPPLLQIEWGNADIFKDQYFILTSATYTLNNFQSAYMDHREKDRKENLYPITDGGLLPSYATQELIFKRASAYSLTYEDMVPKSKLNLLKQ